MNLTKFPIAAVWTMLGGGPLKRFGSKYRGQAWWRNGDGWNVSIDRDKGVWHDKVTRRGGGILHLVADVRGCSLSEAAQWLDPEEKQPYSGRQRREYAQRRQAAEDLAQRVADWGRGQWLSIERAKAVAFRTGDDRLLEVTARALYALESATSEQLLERYHADPKATDHEAVGRTDREHADGIAEVCVSLITKTCEAAA